jgi:hypothetical protein
VQLQISDTYIRTDLAQRVGGGFAADNATLTPELIQLNPTRTPKETEP